MNPNIELGLTAAVGILLKAAVPIIILGFLLFFGYLLINQWYYEEISLKAFLMKGFVLVALLIVDFKFIMDGLSVFVEIFGALFR